MFTILDERYNGLRKVISQRMCPASNCFGRGRGSRSAVRAQQCCFRPV